MRIPVLEGDDRAAERTDVVPSIMMLDPDDGRAIVWPDAVIVEPGIRVWVPIRMPEDEGRRVKGRVCVPIVSSPV